jgi:hypothetical protein
LSAWALGGVNGYIYSNAYYDGTNNRYINTGTATAMGINNATGQFFWNQAASGTAGNVITFTTGMTLDPSQNLSAGTTSVASSGQSGSITAGTVIAAKGPLNASTTNAGIFEYSGNKVAIRAYGGSAGSGLIAFSTGGGGNSADSERARILADGSFLWGNTGLSTSSNMMYWNIGNGTSGHLVVANTEGTNATSVMYLNRQGSDGTLIEFRQADTSEGSISVSGSTVSYNGGHLSRWAQTTAPKDDTLVKGTVLSNLDEMSVYTKDGQLVANEQLNKVKVSDTEGDANVAGVFVNWSHDEVHNVDEINMAMTGDMIIRIAQGVTVVRGDLLMSAGDGTAKPQGDDIVRSKTIAKVTSNHVTCTYADGSYCVPCVLMAC